MYYIRKVYFNMFTHMLPRIVVKSFEYDEKRGGGVNGKRRKQTGR